MIVLGIDPGVSGAIAAIYTDQPPQAWDAPCVVSGSGKRVHNEAAMRQLLMDILASANGQFVAAVLEDVHSLPRDGRASAFKFGESKGLWRGLLVGLGIPYLLASPSVWRPQMVGVGKDKRGSLLAAARLFPSCNLTRAKDHNRAEALLLAAYGARYGGANFFGLAREGNVSSGERGHSDG